MKLSRLYSNKPRIFTPINFATGLNVILAEIRMPENKKKDTHNLGKTILGRMIDFCLLSQRDKEFFLFKHEERFKKFVFFIEIELFDGTFLTVRRSVVEATKISFKKHNNGRQDFTALPETGWDHVDLPFERSKELLDSLLDLRSIKPWSYRKGLGYLLRSQDDYRDVFQLKKFASAHSDWKPYLAHILGLNGILIEDHYRKEEELTKKQEIAQTIKNELGGSLDNLSRVEGKLLLKQTEAEKRQKLLDAFDFRTQDKQKTKEIVDEINGKIAELNSRRYYLSQNRKKINESLEEEQMLFNPDEAAKLFKEAGVFFGGQIKRDYEQLIAFNQSITVERRAYLDEELREIDNEMKEINKQLSDLGKRRSNNLSFLSGTDPFTKYKQLTDDLVTLKADIVSLERQRNSLQRMQELRKEIRTLEDEKEHLQRLVEDDVEKQSSEADSLFSSIRLFFNEILEEVIDRQALLNVEINKEGHLDFKPEILDESGNTTSADMGHTYRKLLCIAFDMAILRAHISDRFPRFVFHDGVFESLDDRKKENLLNVIRKYSNLGIQHIITLIDSDLPPKVSSGEPIFADFEIVLKLHDEDDSGRLFKMKPW